jgi:hypothetical protein
MSALSLRSASSLFFGVLVCAGLNGCGQPDDEETAAASITGALQASQNGGLSTSALEAIDSNSASQPIKAAQLVEQRAMPGLSPAGCVVKTRNDATVHIEFHDCTGPFGRVTLRGGMDATFRLGDDQQLHADVQDSGDLTANGNPLAYRATAKILVDGAQRDVTWNGSWSGTTKRGKSISKTSSLHILVDTSTHCLDIVGSVAGKVDRFDLESTIDGLKICADRCPTAGDITTVVTGRRGERTMEIHFDGTNSAHVKGLRGDQFDVPLACEEAEAE